MISVQIHLDDLTERIDTANRLVNATDPLGGAATTVSREARGLALVLLFAAYENLLKSLTRTVLEGAKKTRVGNRRLKPGFQTFALESALKSARDRSERKIFESSLPDMVQTFNRGGFGSTINLNSFPSDGSFMKRSQIDLWCQIFDVPQPEILLSRIWPTIDTVVRERNAIAHGQQTPESIGRNYTRSEMVSLIADWHSAWSNFLNHVGALAQSRDFFRTP